jgi:hypothetical protein
MSLCLTLRFSWIITSTLRWFSSWVIEMGRPDLCSSKTLISPAQQLTKLEYTTTLYRLPNACANVSFLPLLATPLGRRPYLSSNLRIIMS